MVDVELIHLTFPRAEPVAISFNTFDKRESYIIVLKHGGVSGIGGGYPFKPITGDTGEELVRDAKALGSLPLDPGKDGPEKLHEILHGKTTCRTLISAMDGAWHDLLGKVKEVPVYKLYSEKKHITDNSITVFLKKTMDETAAEVKKIFTLFPDLKILKIKLKGEQDLQRCRVIKEASPDGIRYVLDANQGYEDPSHAVKELDEIGTILGDVILVEEPCEKGDLDKMKYVKEHLDCMMVFADESATGIKTVREVEAAKAAHGVNIKLQKMGGIWPSMEVAQFCREKGLKVMVGAMIEDNVGLTAGAQFAAANDNILFTDLDTDLELPPFLEWGSLIDKGVRQVTDDSGMGINLSMETIKELEESGDMVMEKIL